MSDLTVEQRHRLEHEVLPAVIDDPEYAAATIVRQDDRVAELEAHLDNADFDVQQYAALAADAKHEIDCLKIERNDLRARVTLAQRARDAALRERNQLRDEVSRLSVDLDRLRAERDRLRLAPASANSVSTHTQIVQLRNELGDVLERLDKQQAQIDDLLAAQNELLQQL